MPSPAPTPPDATRARYEALLEVAESIAAHRKLSTLFADLSRLLNRLVSFDFISLTLLDARQGVVRLHILETDRPVVGPATESLPSGEGPTGLVLQTRQPYYVPDGDQERRFPVLDRKSTRLNSSHLGI